tara:strand:- start:1224 stop:2195 length:972 start_codon:yes stop_codon:yes gene_type:complete
MNPHIDSDDELIETTLQDNSINNSMHTNDNKNNDDDDDDEPTASGTMILAEQPNYTSALSYTGNKMLSLISWIGSGLYSLTTAFSGSSTPEEQHMHILNTIAKLNNHLLFLDKKIECMNLNSARFSQEAKRLYKSKKIPSAMHQIRLKKMYDCEISKLEKLKFNIETNILHMDSVEIMMVTVDTIKDTSEHFQKINSTLNIEKLEDTIDELVEHRDAATDIQSVLNDMQMFNEANYNEEDLMKELQMISNEENTNENTNENINQNGEIGTAYINNVSGSESNAIRIEDLPEPPSTALPNRNAENNIRIKKNIMNNRLELSATF